jgi:hypothetical protein
VYLLKSRTQLVEIIKPDLNWIVREDNKKQRPEAAVFAFYMLLSLLLIDWFLCQSGRGQNLMGRSIRQIQIFISRRRRIIMQSRYFTAWPTIKKFLLWFYWLKISFMAWKTTLRLLFFIYTSTLEAGRYYFPLALYSIFRLKSEWALALAYNRAWRCGRYVYGNGKNRVRLRCVKFLIPLVKHLIRSREADISTKKAWELNLAADGNNFLSLFAFYYILFQQVLYLLIAFGSWYTTALFKLLSNRKSNVLISQLYKQQENYMVIIFSIGLQMTFWVIGVHAQWLESRARLISHNKINPEWQARRKMS